MSRIIKDDAIVDDAWSVFRLGEGESAATVALPEQPALLPLALWQARKEEIIGAGAPIGVWLASSEGVEAIAADLPHFALVALDFPKFTDGRAYSSARLLRERYAYRGEVRAIGDVLRDQLFFMKRCGFNAFALREGKDIDAALSGFSDFSERYQNAVDVPLPLFRRRSA